MHTLTLYHRADCHLCDDMLRDLGRMQAGLDFEISRVDIDADPALKRRFNEKIPVLALGEDIICCHRLDELALRQALSDG
ncbi:glutaredoxin family protein [Acidihalobacter prosperus]